MIANPKDSIPDAPARIVAVQDDLVVIESVGADTPIVKNEVIYVAPEDSDERLKAEVLRVEGSTAVAQVFEDTRGIRIGDPVLQTGRMLSVKLGPGLLGQVYDGLQNPLEQVANRYGFFLKRGAEVDALDNAQQWSFQPQVAHGAKLVAGDVVGTVQEGRYEHKIMVPFDLRGQWELDWVQEGNVTVDQPIAAIRDAKGRERELTLSQQWPVRVPLPERLLAERHCERQYPDTPLITQQRLIDTFFPIARGGTGCIPGPFGAGKTVLQNLISKFSAVDIVIVVACGERAGEVVETISEFPQLKDPNTGGSLMDRTVIICNTSSMPVSAREASIYTGITIGEYYRQMGHNVLMLADSTSRWAQAIREISGRMEEIPGEEAFPAYLDSAIRGVYERAGIIAGGDGRNGSLTIIGTVSPAGGNFEEPVTQSTLSTVKTFLGLSADRAYKRFYPAVDPLLSWTRYSEQLSDWYDHEMEAGWTVRVAELLELLRRGDSVLQMMQVTGEEGITLDDFVTFHRAQFVDMVYLQQDAFDEVDAATPIDRQREMFNRIYALVTDDCQFDDKEAVREHFTRLTGLVKNLNYTRRDSPGYEELLAQIESLAESVRVPVPAGE
ncbi:MAG: V-type ATP synthase subunit A [Woeseiaceae bacterium]|nr:V-type ATP synthase subunit A [Woeseiaceae bacterium]